MERCEEWCCLVRFFFFKQKTAYEMRISDWSSDVCSSDLSMDAASHENRKAIVAEIDELAKDYEKRGMTVTFLAPDQPEYAQWKEETQPLLEEIGRASCRERVCRYV